MKSPKLIKNIPNSVSLSLKPCKIVARREFLKDDISRYGSGKTAIAETISKCVRQGEYDFSPLFEDKLEGDGYLFSLAPPERLQRIIEYLGYHLPDSSRDIKAITLSNEYIVYWSLYNTCLKFTIRKPESERSFLVLTGVFSNVATPLVDYSQVIEGTPNNNYYKEIASEWKNNFVDVLLRTRCLTLPPRDPVSWEVDFWERGEYNGQLPWIRFTFNIPMNSTRKSYFIASAPQGIEIKEMSFLEGIGGNPDCAYIRISANPERCIILQ